MTTTRTVLFTAATACFLLRCAAPVCKATPIDVAPPPAESSTEAAAALEAEPAKAPVRLPPRRKHLGSSDAEPDKDLLGAKHLVVMYSGSMRAPATVTRSKDEARALAEKALIRIKLGDRFEDVAGQYSDEPSAKQRGGDLGKFSRKMMDPTFSKAVEALRVGEVSGVVETPFGFHVILRTQ